MGSIPFSEIVAYMDYVGVAGRDERDDFMMLIYAMDHEFRSFHNEQAEKERKENDRNRHPRKT